jgi:hypothetical protein
MGRSAEWVTLYNQDGILVQTGSAAMLLAMYLRAAERRGLRDFDDIDTLLAVLGIRTADEAEDLMNGFSPSEDLSPRTYDHGEEAPGREASSGVPSEPPGLLLLNFPGVSADRCAPEDPSRGRVN